MSILRLAVPSPLRSYFDYLPPPDLTPEQVGQLRPGQRVLIPFGRRKLTGFLVQVLTESDLSADMLKHALEILDPEPLPGPALMRLLQWTADYYHHPPGEVYSCAFPPKLRRAETAAGAGVPGWRMTARGKGLPRGALERSPRQARALALLQENDTLLNSRFKEEGISAAILRALRDKGLIEPCSLTPDKRPPSARPGLDLNRQQSDLLQQFRSEPDGFSCHLLEGITGSGKTEIYLQLIADCLNRGQQALVLIPEIGLTPQTLQRFEDRFDARIVTFHSGLSDGERYRAWEAARAGLADIVIGTRSAVFTPLRAPGLIVVDEEHDSSYKQQDGFRYSARDVAVKRAQIESCPILLGSATPSLESLHNALEGRYRLHRLSQRAGGASKPTLEILDIRHQPLTAGLSEQLADAMEDNLQRGGQTLLFLNRRGYAPTLRCHDCGWIASCEACDARMTVHRRQRRLRCHHCCAAQYIPHQCPLCQSHTLLAAGLGTEQTEAYLQDRFGNWPVHRVDSDSIRGRDAMQSLIDAVNRGEPCTLLGTQMLAKGHHFPAVSLVAVIDADAMLFSSDFRGEERMAQLLTQVAGRAGRADVPGHVIMQTHYPDHPSLQAILSQPYHDQAREMLTRRRTCGMPPVGRLALLRTDCVDAETGEEFLRLLRQQSEPMLPPGTALVGPLPSPMQRRAGKYRSQLLLTAPGAAVAQRAATLLVDTAETLPRRKGLKWTIDIDPTDSF